MTRLGPPPRGWRLDGRRSTLSRAGVTLALWPQTYTILATLLGRPVAGVSEAEIGRAAGLDPEAQAATLRAAVSRARSALRAVGLDLRRIRAVPGRAAAGWHVVEAD